jgi:hypothetical protein
MILPGAGAVYMYPRSTKRPICLARSPTKTEKKKRDVTISRRRLLVSRGR